MNDPRIRVAHLSKQYVRRRNDKTWQWNDPLGFRSRQTVNALADVSFCVGPGEALGIIGANGAGKSTLLRLLGDVGRPTSGEIHVSGRIGALLDLGGGFLTDLTGFENAMLAGVVAGLTKSEVKTRLPRIEAFAELESSMNQPLRTFSTGMQMRLAFSVAIHTDPEILLIDEFLSVGDLSFQSKCAARIQQLRDAGCAIILVSHGMDQVRQLCDRALWLRDGKVLAFDSARTVTTAYETEMHAETLRRTRLVESGTVAEGRTLRMHETRFGSQEAQITGVRIYPAAIASGSPLEVVIDYHASSVVPEPAVVASITRDDGTLCVDTNTQLARVAVPDLLGDGSVLFTIDRLEIGAGRYFVNVGLFEAHWSHAYDYHWQVYPLAVNGAEAHRGLLAPPCHWKLVQKNPPERSLNSGRMEPHPAAGQRLPQDPAAELESSDA